MSEDRPVPILVYSGPYEEVLFLKTLIESAGIETSFNGPTRRSTVGSEWTLYVRRADAEHASDLVADFRKNGHRTTG